MGPLYGIVVVQSLSYVNCLWPHGLQHATLPWSLPSPGVCSNSCPLSRWCCLTISSSVTLLPSALSLSQHQVFFPMSRLFTSGSHSIGASASVLPMNIQDWFPLRLMCLISLLSKGLSRVSSSTTVWKHQFLSVQPSLWSNSHISTWILEKPQLWLDRPLLAEWCLCFLVCCLYLS